MLFPIVIRGHYRNMHIKVKIGFPIERAWDTQEMSLMIIVAAHEMNILAEGMSPIIRHSLDQGKGGKRRSNGLKNGSIDGAQIAARKTENGLRKPICHRENAANRACAPISQKADRPLKAKTDHQE